MTVMLPSLVDTLLLVLAVSTDAFVASFAYGTGQIRIPPLSVAVISVICTLTLAVSLLAGCLVRPLIPAGLTRYASSLILCVMGTAKLFDSSIKAYIRKKKHLEKELHFSLSKVNFILNIYADPPEADKNRSQVLSPLEAASLAAALSIDGLAVGFGASLSFGNPTEILLLSLLCSALAVMVGRFLGERLMTRWSKDLSWIGGALLLLLAILKL